MSEKIEGTISLEGLVEGPLPPFPDAQQKLEKWASGFAGGRVRISLQVDGGHFSALPSNEPVAVKGLAKEGGEPAQVVADSLADLLRFFPPLERARVFSTLRSVEYRHGQEVQTLFAVGPDGRAVTRQQSVACATVKPAEPVSGREALKRGLVGLVVAAAILALSAIWVPYPAIWRQLTARVEPVKVSVETGSFAPYFRAEVAGLDRRDGTLKLKLTRTAAYPRDEAALDALYADPPATPVQTASAVAATAAAPATKPATATAPASAASTATAPAPAQPMSLVRRRLAVEALAKGSVWLEFRDQNGAIIGGAALRIEPLQRVESLEAAVPAPVVDRQTVAPSRIEVLPQ